MLFSLLQSSTIWKENGPCRVVLIILLLSWRIMAESFKVSSFFRCRKDDLKPISDSELSRKLNPSAEEFAQRHTGHLHLSQGSRYERRGCSSGFQTIRWILPCGPPHKPHPGQDQRLSPSWSPARRLSTPRSEIPGTPRSFVSRSFDGNITHLTLTPNEKPARWAVSVGAQPGTGPQMLLVLPSTR